jgi:endonuclease/exonuclease/phosphatase family metal-dependent hydrolase
MRGTDGRRDPERIARVIARLAGMRGAFGPTAPRLGHPYGNAILSLHPIEAIRCYDLSVAGREPRGCVRADVSLPEARLHFFVAHLGLSWRERRRQAAQLLSADILRDAALSHPLVLVGDFNSISGRAGVPRWLRRQLVDAARAAGNEAPTFPSLFPLLRLDHCYVAPALEVRAVTVVRSEVTRRASDHLPLLVELAVTPAARQPPAARPVQAAGVETAVLAAPGPRG